MEDKGANDMRYRDGEIYMTIKELDPEISISTADELEVNEEALTRSVLTQMTKLPSGCSRTTRQVKIDKMLLFCIFRSDRSPQEKYHACTASS